MYAINIKWETRFIVLPDVLRVVVLGVLLIESAVVLLGVPHAVVLDVLLVVVLGALQCVVDAAQATSLKFNSLMVFNFLKEIKNLFF